MRLPYWRLAALATTCAAGAMLAGCDDSYLDAGPGRSEHPVSGATLAEMAKIDTTPSSPMLIRAYKKEAELEIWKMNSEGRYALLKTYPICRWSGQLGPKKVEGDMQVPEGFYTIAPGQLNPNSHYYLAFNVGYPNAYDRAYGRTGGSVMVHGVCSSAGCFSMTDEQVNDIYAITRDALRGGQREVQLESFPFRMTAQNLAKHRLDPNIDFWKELKEGSDHFEVTKTEPTVVVCGKHYVFDATPKGPVSATAPCPALQRDDEVEALVAEKEAKDDAKIAELAASGVKPIRIVYADGGQNPVFAGYKDTSDPEALAGGPQEIVLNEPAKTETAKTVSPAVAVASAEAAKRAHVHEPAAEPVETAAVAAPASAELAAAPAAAPAAPAETASTAAPAETAATAVPDAKPQPVAIASTAAAGAAGIWGAGTQNVKRWLHVGGVEPAPEPAATAYVADPSALADTPLPPRRTPAKPVHVALKAPMPPAKPADAAKPEETEAPVEGNAPAAPAPPPVATAPAPAAPQ